MFLLSKLEDAGSNPATSATYFHNTEGDNVTEFLRENFVFFYLAWAGFLFCALALQAWNLRCMRREFLTDREPKLDRMMLVFTCVVAIVLASSASFILATVGLLLHLLA